MEGADLWGVLQSVNDEVLFGRQREGGREGAHRLYTPVGEGVFGQIQVGEISTAASEQSSKQLEDRNKVGNTSVSEHS